jgi:hypothetical protein
MNKTENKLYEKSEKAESLSIDLQEILHEIFYDPDGASEKDIEDMLEILGILKQATKLATRIEKRLHG